jgi:hypothetical protein
VAEPQPGPLWRDDPRIRDEDSRALLTDLGAEFLPFESRHFGAAYPYGNKIEALLALPKGEPFVFFDTDTLICSDLASVPFDFARPTASLRREGTWPQIELYGPSYTQIWKSLYDRFGLDFETSLDPSQPDGNTISISTQGSFSTNARMSLVNAFSTTRSASAMKRRAN